jgi:hypothetical protein
MVGGVGTRAERYMARITFDLDALGGAQIVRNDTSTGCGCGDHEHWCTWITSTTAKKWC